MATFATLKTRVEDYLIDLPNKTETLVGDWINLAIRAAQQRHNFRVMEATQEETTVLETRKLADKPARWKEARVAPWMLEGDGGSKEFQWAPSRSDMIRLYSEDDDTDTGEPKFLLETATELLVYPLPDDNSLWNDGNYRIRVPYWEYTAALSADGDTNWFTEDAEWYVTFYATAEGMIFNREEERAQVYMTKAEQEFTRIRRVDKQSHMPRRMELGAYADVHATRESFRR